MTGEQTKQKQMTHECNGGICESKFVKSADMGVGAGFVVETS